MGFKSKNLLVTGGAGFIGSNFINYLLAKHPKLNIINIDSLTYASNLSYLKPIKSDRYIFYKGNICDAKLLESIFKKNQIDGVINFAAETHVDNSILNPDIFIRTNINGTYNLLRTCYKCWMEKPFVYKKDFKNARFHQISTDEVYGSILKGNFNEKSNYSPNSPYSASKASADMLVRCFNNTYGLNTTISISSNNYGPNQNNEKFIPKVINCFFNDIEIPIYGDGLNVRDWIHVEDHCNAIDKIFNNSESGKVYNIGGKNELSNISLVEKIYNVISEFKKVNKRVAFVNDRYGHDRRYSLDISLIKDEIGWVPETVFDDGIRKLITDFYKKINKN